MHNGLYLTLAEAPGIACGKKNFEEKKISKKNFEKTFLYFYLAYVTPRPPLSVQKKISAQSVQPFGRL